RTITPSGGGRPTLDPGEHDAVAAGHPPARHRGIVTRTPTTPKPRRAHSGDGNSFLSWSSDPRRPYSHTSNASAYFTFFPRSGPYHRSRASRYRSATSASRLA